MNTVNKSDLSKALKVKSDLKAGTTIIIIIEPSPPVHGGCPGCGIGGVRLQAANKA